MAVVLTIVLLTTLSYLGVISLRVGDPVEILAGQESERESIELSDKEVEDTDDPSSITLKADTLLESL